MESFDLKSDDVCEFYLLCKMSNSLLSRTLRSEELLDILLTDEFGLFRSATEDAELQCVACSESADMFIGLNICLRPFEKLIKNQIGQNDKGTLTR